MNVINVKNISFFLFILFITCSSQRIVSLEESFYKQAYQYLSDDSTIIKGLIVCDSVVYIEKESFWEELKEEKESSIDAITRLSNLDEKDRHLNTYSTILSNLFVTNNKKANLFFSQIENNILYAEFFEKINSNSNYDRNKMFNTGYIYMFLFDKKGQLDKVYKKTIAYD